MIDKKIEDLLNSDLEADNQVGWELIKAKKVPYADVVDYVERSKIPTNWMHRYIWDGSKFIKNSYPSVTMSSPNWYPISTGDLTVRADV